MVERSGAPVNGIDPNWLQHQFQIQQQPALVAHMIQSGQAPRMNAQTMIGYGRPKRSGCSSPFFQVVFGIIGFVAIVGGILYGINVMAKNKLGGLATNPNTIVSGAPQVSEKTLKEKGLDPKINYPFWPLVYDQSSMVADKETISGKVTNYGDKPVSNIMIQFGLFSLSKDKIGTAEDQLASLGPGETWLYKAGVKGIDYDQCRVESIIFK
jgi:hypothetical protein